MFFSVEVNYGGGRPNPKEFSGAHHPYPRYCVVLTKEDRKMTIITHKTNPKTHSDILKLRIQPNSLTLSLS